jgi:hypothetical protein
MNWAGIVAFQGLPSGTGNMFGVFLPDQNSNAISRIVKRTSPTTRNDYTFTGINGGAAGYYGYIK